MKKMIAMLLASATVVSAFGVTAFADEQAPVKETVVYTNPDPNIIQMSTTYTDGGGNTYKTTLIPETARKDILGQTVTWSDGTNTFVLDGNTGVVTVIRGN